MTKNIQTTRKKQGPIRIQVLSDLHTEFGTHAVPDPNDVLTDAEIVVLAGDTGRAHDAVAIAAKLFPFAETVMVGGNHEHYGTSLTIDEGLDLMHKAAEAHSMNANPVHVLENETCVISVRGTDVRFVGATLWTDMALFGDPVRDRLIVQNSLNDFRRIKAQVNDPLQMFLGAGDRPLTTSEWLSRHEQSCNFLREELEKAHDGPTVVVIHHLPSMRSVNKKWRNSRVSAGFASKLDDLLDMNVTLLVHGHTHDSCTWRAPNGAYVVCNPAGYARWNGTRENTKFDPKMVIDIRKGGPENTWRAGKERKKLDTKK